LRQRVLIKSIERGVWSRGTGAGGRKDLCTNRTMSAIVAPNRNSFTEQKAMKQI
jgi:hypothetical protein